VLTITVPQLQSYDEVNEMFLSSGPDTELQLEHSLISLSKWEQKWEKPFLSDAEKTDEQTLDYIRIMTLTPGVAPEVYQRLSQDNMDTISDYIGAKMTATWFTETPNSKPKKKDVITAEIIYWMMISLQIPFEAQTWHLNSLTTLIRVINEKNIPEKDRPKLSPAEEYAQRNALNEQRKAEMGTRG
jgi:hypothetical protein